MNWLKEIQDFRETQKTVIAKDMFILWEYKLSRNSVKITEQRVLDLLKEENVYLKTDSASIDLKVLDHNTFLNTLLLYKQHNNSLYSFCNRMISAR